MSRSRRAGTGDHGCPAARSWARGMPRSRSAPQRRQGFPVARRWRLRQRSGRYAKYGNGGRRAAGLSSAPGFGWAAGRRGRRVRPGSSRHGPRGWLTPHADRRCRRVAAGVPRLSCRLVRGGDQLGRELADLPCCPVHGAAERFP